MKFSKQVLAKHIKPGRLSSLSNCCREAYNKKATAEPARAEKYVYDWVEQGGAFGFLRLEENNVVLTLLESRRQREKMKVFLIVLGAIISIFSAFFVAAAIGDLVSPDPSDETGTGVIVGLLLLFGAMMAGGIVLIVKAISSDKKREQDRIEQLKKEKERTVLNLIRQKNGKITPIEVATETQLTIQESQQILDDLCGHAGGSLHATDSGGLIYHFDAIMGSGPIDEL